MYKNGVEVPDEAKPARPKPEWAQDNRSVASSVAATSSRQSSVVNIVTTIMAAAAIQAV